VRASPHARPLEHVAEGVEAERRLTIVAERVGLGSAPVENLANWHVIKDPRLREATLQKIAEVRAVQSKPLTDELLKWAREQRGLPGSKLREAISPSSLSTTWTR
jgi:hypothetical protein